MHAASSRRSFDFLQCEDGNPLQIESSEWIEMARISELTDSGNVAAGDWVPAVRNGSTVRVNVQQIVVLTQAEYDALSPPVSDVLYVIRAA